MRAELKTRTHSELRWISGGSRVSCCIWCDMRENAGEEKCGPSLQTSVNNRMPGLPGSTYRSLLRRQLDVSWRPPSPPSRCHISTIQLDPNFCLRSPSSYLFASKQTKTNVYFLYRFARTRLILTRGIEDFLSSVHDCFLIRSDKDTNMFQYRPVGSRPSMLMLLTERGVRQRGH